MGVVSSLLEKTGSWRSSLLVRETLADHHVPNDGKLGRQDDNYLLTQWKIKSLNLSSDEIKSSEVFNW